MVMRYSAVTNILVTGNTLAHGLGGTPDEFFFSPTQAIGGSWPYFMGVSATNLTLATTVGGCTGRVFASVVSTLVK
jgi:hypothetical protein